MKDDDLPPTDDDGWGEFSTGGGPKKEPPKKPAPEKPKASAESKPKTRTPDEAPPARKAPAPSVKTSEETSSAAGEIGAPDPKPAPRVKRAAAKVAVPKIPKPAKPAADEGEGDVEAPEAVKPEPAVAKSVATKHKPDSKKPKVAEPKRASKKEEKTPKKEGKGRLFFRRKKKTASEKKAGPKKKPPPPPADGGATSAGGSKRKWILGAMALLGLGAFITFSVLNKRKFFYVCYSKKITAERGRFFPFGTTELEGDEWRAISIDEAYDCQDNELGTENALAEKFAQSLLERADSSLAKEDSNVDEIDKQLSQALLLTRGGSKRRARVERLRGDVAYRRAQKSVREAREALESANKTFDEAATKRPIHARNAGAWSKFAGELAGHLGQGPHELCTDKPDAEVPVIPPIPTAGEKKAPDTSAPPDAGVPAGPDSAPPTRGGVLL